MNPGRDCGSSPLLSGDFFGQAHLLTPGARRRWPPALVENGTGVDCARAKARAGSRRYANAPPSLARGFLRFSDLRPGAPELARCALLRTASLKQLARVR